MKLERAKLQQQIQSLQEQVSALTGGMSYRHRHFTSSFPFL